MSDLEISSYKPFSLSRLKNLFDEKKINKLFTILKISQRRFKTRHIRDMSKTNSRQSRKRDNRTFFR